jgi:long-chain acyl-CoA synthetase
MVEHLFLTGGTGFIGSRLLRIWLGRTTANVTLLVRPRGRMNGADRKARLLAAFPRGMRGDLERRLSFAEGDLADGGLGLKNGSLDAPARTVTHIVHAGAELRFNLPLARARRTNTAGTAAVLDFARRCPRLESFQYMSTAYVAGSRRGVVREEGANGAAEHNNTYEQSKYEAEDLVRKAMSSIPASVLRPTIVTCERVSGYVPPTTAFFRLLHGIGTGALDALPGRPETPLDMVPVDYVVEAAFALSRRRDLGGRFFHLSAGKENVISLGDMMHLASACFARGPVAILPPEEFRVWAEGVRRAVPRMGSFLDEIELYAPYLNDHPSFDDTNTRQTLESAALPPRTITEYFDRVASFVRDSNPQAGN